MFKYLLSGSYTVEGRDEAVKKSASYRAPGH